MGATSHRPVPFFRANLVPRATLASHLSRAQLVRPNNVADYAGNSRHNPAAIIQQQEVEPVEPSGTAGGGVARQRSAAGRSPATTPAGRLRPPPLRSARQ